LKIKKKDVTTLEEVEKPKKKTFPRWCMGTHGCLQD
jgi:hypothetical protein